MNDAPVVFIALQQFCQDDVRPLKLLEESGFTVQRNTLGRRLRREEMVSCLRDADAVVAGVEPYDAQVLGQLSRLRCISRCGVGLETVDLDAAQQRGIRVYTTPDEIVEPAAQLTVAMILALARNLSRHLTEFREGKWIKQTGALLSEWTIGLIGFGRIGKAVAQYLRVFEPRLLVADPAIRPEQLPHGIELLELPVVLREADVVSLHASRRVEEGPLIGRQELAMMKPGSYLVNTARGLLIDEGALYEVLRAGRLAGAALDVFQKEPYTGPLAQLPNVLCTPHVATLTRKSRAMMEWRCAENVLRHFDAR